MSPIGVEQFGATILPDVPGAAVTGQAIRNWIREGMPGAQRDERGRWLIVDPDAARAWCERVKAEAMAALRAGRRANAPPASVSIGRGGARAGAGRKKGTTTRTPGAAWRKTELGAVATAVEPIIPPTPVAPASSPTASLSTAAAERLEHSVDKVREEARKLKLQNDQKSGLLLLRADVERTWTAAGRAVQAALNSIAADAADRVVLAFALGSDARPAAVRAVQAAVDRAALAVVKAIESGTPLTPSPPSQPAVTAPTPSPTPATPTPTEANTGDVHHGEAGTEDRCRPAGGT